MKSEQKIEALLKRYPRLFKENSPRAGFHIGPGWLSLVEILCGVIDQHLDFLPEETRGEFEVLQVKEKFGGLRFYLSHETPFLSGAIRMAENMSYRICEDCGKPAELRSGNYIRTMCNAHHKKFMKRFDKTTVKNRKK